jgi:hypothetical protein
MVSRSVSAGAKRQAQSRLRFAIPQIQIEAGGVRLAPGGVDLDRNLRRAPKVFSHKAPGGGKNTLKAQHLQETWPVLLCRVFFPRAHKDGGVENTSGKSKIDGFGPFLRRRGSPNISHSRRQASSPTSFSYASALPFIVVFLAPVGGLY